MAQSKDSNTSDNKPKKATLNIPKKSFRSAGGSSDPKKANPQPKSEPPKTMADSKPAPQPEKPKAEAPKPPEAEAKDKPKTIAPAPKQQATDTKQDAQKPPKSEAQTEKKHKPASLPKATPVSKAKPEEDADLQRYQAKHKSKTAAESFEAIAGSLPEPPKLIADQLDVRGKVNDGSTLLSMSIVVAVVCLLGLLGAFIAFELLPDNQLAIPPLHLAVYGGLVFVGVILPLMLLILAKGKRRKANTELGKTLLEIADGVHEPQQAKKLLQATDKNQELVAIAMAQQQDEISKLRYWTAALAANQPIEATIPPPIDTDLASLKPIQQHIQTLSTQLEDSRWMAHSLGEAARSLQKESKEQALPRTLVHVFNNSFKDALIGIFQPLYDGKKLTKLQLVDSESGKTKSKFTKSSFAASHDLFSIALKTQQLQHIRQVNADVVHYMDPTIDPEVQDALAIPVYRDNLLQFVVIVLGFSKLPAQYEQLVRVAVTLFEKRLVAFDANREVNSLEKDKTALQAELSKQQQELNQFQQDIQEIQLELVLSQKELTEQVAALNNASLVLELDTKGSISDVNDQFAEKIGQQRRQLIGQSLDSLLTNDSAITDDILSVVSAGKIWNGELLMEAQPHPIWLSATFSPIRNQKAEVVKSICVLTDISVQKSQSEELQEALTQSEQQAKALEEAQAKMQATQLELKGQISALNESAVVSETNLKGEIIEVNRQFLMLSGYSEDEIIGKNHRILKSGHQPDQVYNDLWKTVSSGNVWHGEFKNRAQDGSMYWVAATIVPVLGTDGKPVKYIGVSFDITAQKLQEEQISTALEISHQQEAELRQSAKELQEAHEEMRSTQIEMRGLIGALNNAGIVSETDEKGNITHVNEALLRVSGYEKEELIGQNHRIFKSGEHDQAFFTKLWEAISNGDIWRGTFRNKAKNSDDFWLSTTITPVLGFDGKPVKYLAVSFDVTGRMRQAAEIEKALASSRKTEIRLEERSQEMKVRENYLQSALEQLAEELDYLRKHEDFTTQLHAYVPAALLTRPKPELDSVGFVSARFEHLTGISTAQLTAGEQRLQQYITPDDLATVQEKMQAVSPASPVYEVHYTLNTPNGELQLFEKGECLYDENGQLQSVYAFLFQPIAQAESQTTANGTAFQEQILGSHAAAKVSTDGSLIQVTDALLNLTGAEAAPTNLSELAGLLHIRIADDAINQATANNYWSDLQKPQQAGMPPLTLELMQTPGSAQDELLLLITSDPGVVKSKLELDKAEAISDSVSQLGEEVRLYEAELNAMEEQFIDLQVFLDQEIKNLMQFYRNQLDAKDEEIAKYRQN